MKYLQILNLTLLALGLTLAVVLAVEAFIYSLYLADAPRLARDLPLLLKFTAAFTALAVASALAYFGHRRQAFWRWPAQILPALAIVAAVAVLSQIKA